MIEILSLVSFFGILIIFLAKIYNLMSFGDFYNPRFILIGGVLSLILWFTFFASYTTAISAETIIDSGTKTYSITDNGYLGFLKIQNIVTALLSINIILSILEGAIAIKGVMNVGRVRKENVKRSFF